MCTQSFADRYEEALPSPQAAFTLFFWHKQDAVPMAAPCPSAALMSSVWAL